MSEQLHPVEVALRSGSHAKNLAKKISDLCATLPLNAEEFTPEQTDAVIRLAAACRASRAVSVAMSVTDLPAIEGVADFYDLFGETYYPVMEDGKRTVGFWSIKDSTTLTPDDVHEWVRDRRMNKKTNKTEAVPVPFGTWWKTHRPDYELYGVAFDRADWQSKIVDADGRPSVNMSYGKPPVLTAAPDRYGNGIAANAVLDTLLERTITDSDPANAARKRECFVLDAGAHLLALRDGDDFRCRKLFCFASTNAGQGTGKSLLQESLAALVPRDAACTVRATEIAGVNLLPLYGSSVCILTEAPSTATDRYTAEDVKAFADAGWKTATEKFVAKRPVRDNSLKMLSSNHLAPLPIDDAHSRRIEFFVAIDADDGGMELRRFLDRVQIENKWTVDELRRCVGWAVLERANEMIAQGRQPFPVARRTIAAAHLLSACDYDYFIANNGNAVSSYSAYRDFRTDRGITWSPDLYKFECTLAMSRSTEVWIDDVPEVTPPPVAPASIDEIEDGAPEDIPDVEPEPTVVPIRSIINKLQYKNKMACAYLEMERIGFAALYAYVTGDEGLKKATQAVRDGTADKRQVLRQIFPGAEFDRFSRGDNIVGFTGLTHIDFDHIKETGSGLTAEDVRDALAEMPGFIIGAVSSRGNGAWAIFNAGDGIKDYATYLAAERSLFTMAEERLSIASDHGLRLPTAGRALGHDADCRICDEAIAGMLPPPYRWKAPTFGVANVKLAPCSQPKEQTADERVRNEKFLEAVVDTACAKIQNATDGEKHNTAIRALANVIICCRDRDIQPLSSWGRRLRDACMSCGLPTAETNSIMAYWRQKTGLAG